MKRSKFTEEQIIAIPAHCSACTETDSQVTQLLKSRGSVVVLAADGTSARFTPKGAAKAIGTCSAISPR